MQALLQVSLYLCPRSEKFEARSQSARGWACSLKPEWCRASLGSGKWEVGNM